MELDSIKSTIELINKTDWTVTGDPDKGPVIIESPHHTHKVVVYPIKEFYVINGKTFKGSITDIYRNMLKGRMHDYLFDKLISMPYSGNWKENNRRM